MLNRLTLLFSFLLIMVGLIAYFSTGMVSWTALIPSILGALMGIIACLSLKDQWKKYFFFPLIFLNLTGLIGSAKGFKGVFLLFRNETIARPGAAIAQTIMASLCMIYLILSLRSFFSNRKKTPPHVIA